MSENRDRERAQPLKLRYAQTLDEERQIYEGLQKSGGLPRFFNNFHHLLPDENNRWGLLKVFFSKPEDEEKFWNAPRRRILSQEGKAHHSERFLNETPRQFYENLDALRDEMGLTDKKILELRSRLPEGREGEKAFYDAVAPLYFRLRELGYSPCDLVE